MASFVETLERVKALTKDVTVEYAGQSFDFTLRQMTTEQQFSMSGLEESDPNTVALGIKYGVEVGDATEEQIMKAPLGLLNLLLRETMAFNGMKIDEKKLSQSEPLPVGADSPNS